MAITIPLKLFAGESRTYRATITNEAAQPLDLSGDVVLEFQVKQSVGAADPALISKTIGAGITLLPQTGATLGQVELALLPADTQSLAGTYAYDLVLISAGLRQYVIPPSAFHVQKVVNQA